MAKYIKKHIFDLSPTSLKTGITAIKPLLLTDFVVIASAGVGDYEGVDGREVIKSSNSKSKIYGKVWTLWNLASPSKP